MKETIFFFKVLFYENFSLNKNDILGGAQL